MVSLIAVKYLRARKKKEPRKECFFRHNYGGKFITELFTSLRDELKGAVAVKYGKSTWIDDFSDSEVVFFKDTEDGNIEYDLEGNRLYYKVTYEVKNGEVLLTSEPTIVKRVTNYVESILPFQSFFNMSVSQVEIKRMKNE